MSEHRLKSCERCDISISDSNRSIICKKCRTVHCEKCWIIDQKYHFCPWCFHIPRKNAIIYYSGKPEKTRNYVGCFETSQNLESTSVYLGLDDIEKSIRLWNFFPLYSYLVKQRALPLNMISDLIIEYRIFMRAKVETQDWDGTQLSPPPLIDIVWHAHILMSQDYVSFCQTVAHRYIHHNPFGEFDIDAKKTRYLTTIEWVYKHYSYSINSKIWCSSELRHQFEPSSKDRFQIFVVGTNGKTYRLIVDNNTKIWMAKVQLQHKTTITISDIRLIYAGKSLENFKTFGEYNIDHESTLHMVLQMRGC